jgi:pyruvate,water dikinase
LTLDIPDAFQGQPEPVARARGDTGGTVEVITGVGASPGVAEGRAVVVTDPACPDFEPGDILVAHTTDPSWASIMFLAKALVVDIGGLLSHAAVVARELGVPCVMGTGNGTEALRTGDICRVDGSAGTVAVLKRAEG